MLAKTTYEKVSFNLPVEIKAEELKLKDRLKISLNTIYRTAIMEYIQRQEVKKWEDGAKIASQELSDTSEDFYEY
ncbi:MAG: hypothetical protein JJW00_04870 [Sulfurimonas sp.]|nr:hypothetical protein [Sulfurimonas sp.]